MITILSYTFNRPWRCECGAIIRAGEEHGKSQGCDWPRPNSPKATTGISCLANCCESFQQYITFDNREMPS